MAWFAIAVVILGLAGISAIKMSKPGIRKHYVKKRTNDHLIVLEIRGSLSRSLKNVMVKDRISPLARVDEKFDGPRPVIRVSESGTELIWRLSLTQTSTVLTQHALKSA